MTRIAVLGSSIIGKTIVFNLLKSPIPDFSLVVYGDDQEETDAMIKDMATIAFLDASGFPQISAAHKFADVKRADIIIMLNRDRFDRLHKLLAIKENLIVCPPLLHSDYTLLAEKISQACFSYLECGKHIRIKGT